MTCCKTSFILCEPVPSCAMQLVIKTPVISAQVTLRFIDKFNKVYYVTKTSDVNGKITIQLRADLPTTEDLPTGLLNQYAGQFKIMAYDANTNHVQWTISGVQYDALIIEVSDVTSGPPIYIIDTIYAQGNAGQFNLNYNQNIHETC